MYTTVSKPRRQRPMSQLDPFAVARPVTIVEQSGLVPVAFGSYTIDEDESKLAQVQQVYEAITPPTVALVSHTNSSAHADNEALCGLRHRGSPDHERALSVCSDGGHTLEIYSRKPPCISGEVLWTWFVRTGISILVVSTIVLVVALLRLVFSVSGNADQLTSNANRDLSSVLLRGNQAATDFGAIIESLRKRGKIDLHGEIRFADYAPDPIILPCDDPGPLPPTNTASATVANTASTNASVSTSSLANTASTTASGSAALPTNTASSTATGSAH
jgi:hypothetical protein